MTCSVDQKHLLMRALQQRQNMLHAEAHTLNGDERDDKLLEAILTRNLMEQVQGSQCVRLVMWEPEAPAGTTARQPANRPPI